MSARPVERWSLLILAGCLLPLGASARAEGRRSTSLVATQDTLTLERAVRIALGRNPDIQDARSRADAAGAAHRANLGSFLPSAQASLNLSRNSFKTVTFPSPEGSSQKLDTPLESVTKSASQGLRFSWDLLRGGRRIAELRQGSAARRATRYRLSATERTVVGTVRRAYYSALKQQGLVEVARRQLEGRRRDLEVARRRYEIAAVMRTDVLGAQILLGQAEVDLLDAQNAERAAKRTLQVAMGREAEGDVVLRDVEIAPAVDPLDVRQLVATAIATQPELAALQADVATASAALWAARTSYIPTISLGFSLNRSESLGPNGDFFTFNPSNRARLFSVSASWNVFDGFGREDQAVQAAAGRRQAEAALTKRRLALEKEVRDFVQEIGSRARRLELQRRNFELAQQRVDLTREQYRLGTIEYVELLQAIQQLTAAERSLITERYDYLSAWANLEERVGDLR
ncbi:MAG: TolC family protein [Gemmatimonadota bacterium]